MILLPAGNASTWTGPTGNNTYLLPGAVPTLIDAGVGNPDHLDALAHALGGQSLAQVLVTHGHSDHVKGVPAITARWPGVRVRQYGAGEHQFADGERIPAGDGGLAVLHTPGHSPDHCCFVSGREVFSGDLMRVGGTVVIPASRGGDLRQYLASLQRVRELAPARVYPGHGPIIEDPASVIEAYIRHRADRDRQILSVLGEGALPADAITARIYKGLPPELEKAAGETILAHLIKLESDGRVVQDEGRWTRGA